MANNSKREQIILADVEILQSIEAIKTVKRTLQSYSDLRDNFALTQLPVAAIIGRLPVPTSHIDNRTGFVDYAVSRLVVDVYVYFQENVDMDTVLSSLLDDMWAALYQNPSRNGLCMYTTIEMSEQNHQVWSPFVAFQVKVIHAYQHTTGGI